MCLCCFPFNVFGQYISGYARTHTMDQLLEAAKTGLRDKVSSLLESGADVNARDELGKTALIYAAEKDNDECVRMIIEAKARVNDADLDGQTALMAAAWKGNSKCVDLLIKAGADVNKHDNSCCKVLIGAIENGNPKCVKLLIEAGADVNVRDPDGKPAVMCAAENCCDKCVNQLVEAGADVNATNPGGITALVTLAEAKHDMVEPYLRAKGVCIDIIGSVKLLLKSGAYVNIYDEFGRNALQCHIAECEPTNANLAQLLLAAGETLGHSTTVRKRDFRHASPPVKVPEYLQKLGWEEGSLRSQCRETIRKHLIQVNPHVSLFKRANKLGLPPLLGNYLVYDISLDDKYEDQGEKGCPCCPSNCD